MAMKKTFVTSDTMFGRENILSIANRNYKTVSEMDNDMIEKWNAKVGYNDTVYHLGNFAWDPFAANNALQNLNGNIIFLLGNKDKALLESISLYPNFKIIENAVVEIPELNAVLCHYPLAHWNGKETGSLHFHGHMINEMKTDIKKMNRVNVCIDNWSLEPINIETINELINEFNNLDTLD